MSDLKQNLPSTPPLSSDLSSSTIDSESDRSYQNSTTTAKLASKRRSRTESLSVVDDTSSSTRPGWEDAYMSTDGRSPSPRQRSARRHTTASKLPHLAANVPSKERSRRQSLATEATTRYLPNLEQIVETKHSKTSSHKSRKDHGSHLREPSVSSSTSRSSYHDELESARGRNVKLPTRKSARKSVTVADVSPSLLSVITGTAEQGIHTDQDSTEEYSRTAFDSMSSASNKEHRMSGSTLISDHEPSSFNVFDYMDIGEQKPASSDAPDLCSPSTSQHEHSMTDSSESPETPSSYSTFSSPTATRADSGSAASLTELRAEHEKRFHTHIPYDGNSETTASHGGRTKRSGTRDFMQVTEIVEDDTSATGSLLDASAALRPHSVMSHTSAGSTGASSHGDLQYPPSAMAHSEHEAAHQYEQRSRDSSGLSSPACSSREVDMYAMTRHFYPTPTPPTWPPGPGYLERKDSANDAAHLPPVPEAPEHNKAPPIGYEVLASELANVKSPVKPLYRKFEYLNHRILLHIQDELSELEEQLAALDSAIAQWQPVDDAGERFPASRRADAHYGTDMHHRRTLLLGDIFRKTEQYNRAMTAFTAMKTDCQPAGAVQIAAYRQWMDEQMPIHEVETKFLLRGDDLVMPGAKVQTSPLAGSNLKIDTVISSSTTPPSWIPAMLLMLPLLLFTSIPTLAARLTVTAVLALAAGTLASTTNIRAILPFHDLVLCGGFYLAFMVAIAVCSS